MVGSVWLYSSHSPSLALRAVSFALRGWPLSLVASPCLPSLLQPEVLPVLRKKAGLILPFWKQSSSVFPKLLLHKSPENLTKM